MSSVTSNNHCQYKFQKGKRQGQICNLACKRNYCNNHSAKTINDRKKYYTDNKHRKLRNQVKANIKKGNVPDRQAYLLKKQIILNNYEILIKKIIGMKIFLGEVSESEAFCQYASTLCRKYLHVKNNYNAYDYFESVEMAKKYYGDINCTLNL